MALLPRVVVRPAALGLLGVVCFAGVAGCSQFDKALGQQQATVYFAQKTTVAFKLKVRAACASAADHVKEVPIQTGVPLSSAVDVVSYDTTGASTVDIAILNECVNRYAPQVVGLDVTDSSDDS